MKSALGVLAALLFVTAMAIGQQSEFPQAANPALENDTYWQTPPSVAGQSNLPTSMAINQSSTDVVMSPSFEERNTLGPEFPNAADPSRDRNTDISTSFEQRKRESGAEFPNAANPSLNQ
jgi:hypothetical protein